jgi:hypothetical protein
MAKKSFFVGMAAVTLALGMALAGCSSASSGGGDSYTISISPSSTIGIKSSTVSFTATLKRNGEAVSSTPSFDWEVAGGVGGTSFASSYSASQVTLTIASGETATTLTVTALTYRGESVLASASVPITIVTADEVTAALNAIKNAVDKDAMLTALKAPKAGIDQHYVIAAHDADYFAAKGGAIATALTASPTASQIPTLNAALAVINANVVVAKFNAATSKEAVQALFTQANYGLLGWSTWNYYAALAPAEKTTVATAIYNGSKPYTYETFGTAVGNAITKAYNDRTKTVFDEFNKATLATEVQKLLTEANFKALFSVNLNDWWTDYAALDPDEKLAVATAVLNNGTDYANSTLLATAIGTAIWNVYTTARPAAALAKFNAAVSAAAVQALLTQANFKALGIGELWAAYSGLPADQKTEVATAVWHSNAVYSTVSDLRNAINNAVFFEVVKKNLVPLQTQLTAAIAPGATAANINGFINFVGSLLSYPVDELPSVNPKNSARVTAAIVTALATQSNPLKVYKDAGAVATAEQTADAIDRLMGIVYGES